MKNKAIQTANTSALKSFTPLSREQLQTITGGGEPTTSRGTKTSSAG